MEKRRIVQVIILVFLGLAIFPFNEHGISHATATSTIAKHPFVTSNPNSALPFTQPNYLEHFQGNNILSTALELANGTILVTWISNRAASAKYNVYINAWNSTGWEKSFNVTNGGQTQGPSLAQFSNNTIILVYSSNQTTTNHYNLYYMTSQNGAVWSQSRQLTSGQFSDYSPRMVLTADSTLWLVWERDTPTGPVTAPYRQIYYETLKNNIWSGENILTPDTTVTNQNPSITIVKGGNIWVAYTRTASGMPSQIAYRSYDGSQWSTVALLTNTTYNDNMSGLVQDRNGTIWLFWQRLLTISGVTQNRIFYKYSSNSATLASASETQLTFGGNLTGVQVEDVDPFVFMSPSTLKLWTFYSSNSFHFEYDIYYLTSQQIYPVHSVISSIQVSNTISYPYGDAPSNIVTITVTVTNTGDLDEYVNVNAKAASINGTYTIGGQSDFVYYQTSTVFTFPWNTAGLPPGRFTIYVTVPAVTGETPGNALGNNSSFKTVYVLLPGALAKTTCVTIIDAGMMGKAFGSVKGGVNWNPDADLNTDSVITIIDFGMLAAKFGKCI